MYLILHLQQVIHNHSLYPKCDSLGSTINNSVCIDWPVSDFSVIILQHTCFRIKDRTLISTCANWKLWYSKQDFNFVDKRRFMSSAMAILDALGLNFSDSTWPLPFHIFYKWVNFHLSQTLLTSVCLGSLLPNFLEPPRSTKYCPLSLQCLCSSIVIFFPFTAMRSIAAGRHGMLATVYTSVLFTRSTGLGELLISGCFWTLHTLVLISFLQFGLGFVWQTYNIFWETQLGSLVCRSVAVSRSMWSDNYCHECTYGASSFQLMSSHSSSLKPYIIQGISQFHCWSFDSCYSVVTCWSWLSKG